MDIIHFDLFIIFVSGGPTSADNTRSWLRSPMTHLIVIIVFLHDFKIIP